MTQATELADATASRDPAVGLAAVASLRRLLESLEALQVANARERGWSWQQIAEVLGVTQAGGAQEARRPAADREEGLMFERFTKPARAVVEGAFAEAGALGAERDRRGAPPRRPGGGEARRRRRRPRRARRARPRPRTRCAPTCAATGGLDARRPRGDRHRPRRGPAAGSRRASAPGALGPARGGRRAFARAAKKALELSLREAIARGDRGIGARARPARRAARPRRRRARRCSPPRPHAGAGPRGAARTRCRAAA